MIIPATSPVMTEHDSPIQLLMPSRYNIPNVAMAINTALTFTPTPNDCSSSRIEAPLARAYEKYAYYREQDTRGGNQHRRQHGLHLLGLAHRGESPRHPVPPFARTEPQ